MKAVLHNLLTDIIAEEFGADVAKSLPFVVTVPPKLELGDYATNAALILGKKLGKSPQEVGEILGERLEVRGESILEKVEVAGGFVNLTLKDGALLSNVQEANSQSSSYGAGVKREKKVLVEYFQNNVAKPPHIGHLRSAVIGDSLKRLFRFLGYEVVSDTHIGDWGVQFGILLYAYKDFIARGGSKEKLEEDPINNLNELYVKASSRVVSSPEDRGGMIAIKTGKSVHDWGKEEFIKLEKGDEENRKLWEWFVEVSKKDFEKYRKLLGLEEFEYNLGESFYEDKMFEVLEELKGKDLVSTGDTGELYVDLEEFALGRCILVKSDGGTTYHLRDFATYKHRLGLGLWKNVYVVDVRQAHHFKQLFKVLELAGYPASQNSVHVDFGFLALPEGPISTRKGNVISLEALINEAGDRATKVIEEKNPELNNKLEVARKVGLAAIKYFDLMHNRESNIVFSWDKALSFDGNTGPYLQYAFVRVKGIERRILQENPKLVVFTPTEVKISEPAERALGRKLIYFKDVLGQAAEEYFPHYIATYLFELAQEFNAFYEEVPVLQAETEEQKVLRLALVRATAQVIKNGLEILGIETVEEM